MYNPFPLLNEKILNEKIQSGRRFFIRQTYPRGLEVRLKAAFLLKGYSSIDKDLALQHLATLKKDGNAFLYDVEDPEHVKKLFTAAQQPFGYKIYYAAKKGEDWKPPQEYQMKIKVYLKQNHSNWKSKPGGEKIAVGLYEEFGKLFLKFSFDGEEDIVPIEEIEK